MTSLCSPGRSTNGSFPRAEPEKQVGDCDDDGGTYVQPPRPLMRTTVLTTSMTGTSYSFLAKTTTPRICMSNSHPMREVTGPEEPALPEAEEPLVPVPEPIWPASPRSCRWAPHGYDPLPCSYGSDPSYAYRYSAEMGGYGHNLVNSINYAHSEPLSPSLSYEHRPQVINANVDNYQYQKSEGFSPPMVAYQPLPTKSLPRVIKSISDKINKSRDEVLWPQTHELIQGFSQAVGMALSQATNIDSTIAAASFGEAQIDLVKQLELQLLDMTTRLAKRIEYVPEETDDGVPPFPLGHLGAPHVFIICNNWVINIARTSQMDVVHTMQAFASNVLHIWKRPRSEWKRC
ncbi:hypothetical protein EJB05_51605, partial [Eragrostis curvula]